MIIEDTHFCVIQLKKKQIPFEFLFLINYREHIPVNKILIKQFHKIKYHNFLEYLDFRNAVIKLLTYFNIVAGEKNFQYIPNQIKENINDK